MSESRRHIKFVYCTMTQNLTLLSIVVAFIIADKARPMELNCSPQLFREGQKCRVEKIVIGLSGELGPIFKVPRSNNFLCCHYCLSCSQNPMDHEPLETMLCFPELYMSPQISSLFSFSAIFALWL